MTTTNLYAPPGAVVADIAGIDAFAERAGRGARLGATILDGIIFGVMVYLPLIVTVGVGPYATAENGANPVLIACGIVTLIGLIAWSWLTIKYVALNGQTIAKKLMRMKVVRRDGSRASLSRIFWLRNVVNGLLAIIPIYGFIDALFIFGESRQCLHDKIADTIVVMD
jgi:uncharacterized RDD family membrane protein YckC